MAKAPVIKIEDMTLEQKMRCKKACEKYGIDPDDVVMVGYPGQKGLILIRPDDPDEKLRTQMIAKGWAKNASEITDAMIKEYLEDVNEDDDETLERAKATLSSRRK